MVSNGKRSKSKLTQESALKGFVGASVLLLVYFTIVILISGWDFAQDQFLRFWYFILALAFGFGIQVGLYTYLKNLIRNTSATVLAASGTTSGAAMISCCAHYLANILPILGITGFVTIVTQYQVQLFWVGLAANLAGILYMSNRVIRYTKGV